MRYDLTAPLARPRGGETISASRYPTVVTGSATYSVTRSQGPGTLPQFMQFDADTVGAASMAADAEIT